MPQPDIPDRRKHPSGCRRPIRCDDCGTVTEWPYYSVIVPDTIYRSRFMIFLCTDCLGRIPAKVIHTVDVVNYEEPQP